MTGKHFRHRQPRVEYVYRHLTMYGYSTATFQLWDPHETWAQTMVESMWHKMSLCIISPVSRDEAYSQTDYSVENCNNLCLALLNVDTSLHPSVSNVGYRCMMFLYSTVYCFTCLDVLHSKVWLTTGRQNYSTSTLPIKTILIISWPTLTSSGPQRAMFESINS